LLVLQIAANHHLQHYKQFAIADIPVPVDVIDPEGEPELLLLVSLGAERTEARHEFLEVDITAAIFVEYGDHAGCKRVRGDLWKSEKFVPFDGSGVVLELVN